MAGLSKLTESLKAMMVLLTFIGLGILVGFGKAPVSLLEHFVTIILPSWLFAHAGEQGAKALARAMEKKKGAATAA